MALCNHMWEAFVEPGSSLMAGKTYKCKHCGATTSENAVVDRLIGILKGIEDGTETTISDLLAPEKYGYSELSHLSLLVSQKARASGIWLDSGDPTIMFVQYYEKFKKRTKRSIVLRKVGKKTGLKYKIGDLIVETIDLTAFGSTHINATSIFCCERNQAQHTASTAYDLEAGKISSEAIVAWEEKVKRANQQYDLVGNVVATTHFGKTIVSINDMSYLLKSDDPLIAELEKMIEFEPKRTAMKEERNSFIGFDYDNPKRGKRVDANLIGKDMKDDPTSSGSGGGGSPLAELWAKLNKPIGK